MIFIVHFLIEYLTAILSKDVEYEVFNDCLPPQDDINALMNELNRLKKLVDKIIEEKKED